MNVRLLSIVAIMAGAVLLYSAVKNKDPREVIKEGLGSRKKAKTTMSKGAEVSPITPMSGGMSGTGGITPPLSV